MGYAYTTQEQTFYRETLRIETELDSSIDTHHLPSERLTVKNNLQNVGNFG